MRAALAWFACTALASASPAPAPEVQVPGNDGWVTDLADMIPADQEQRLELLMESYRQGSSHEIAVLTVPELGGESIEGLALAVARAWGIGGAETSNGALLVVASSERRMRIEVGRGLEGTLPDVICARIIRDVMTPAFQRGDFAGGIEQGVLAIHAAIGGDYGPLERSSRGRQRSGGAAGLAFFGFLLAILLTRRRRGGPGAGSGGSALPWLLMGGLGNMGSGGGGFGGGGGGFGGFGGGGGFSGGGSSGGW